MEELLFEHIMDSVRSMSENQTLFKYFDLDTGVKSLRNQNIAFSRPDRFNDPFDCSVELLNIDAAETRTHMSGAFVRILGSNYSERFRLKRQLSKATDYEVEALAKKGMAVETTHRGITCFSTSFDEILMWAHYCKNHNGICIGYNTVKLYSFLRSRIHEIGYFPVNYVDQISKKNLYPVNNDAILYMLKTKSAIWKYEKEVRITGTMFSFNEYLMNFVKLDHDIISHIYIGINVNQEQTNQILKFANEINPKLSIFRMRADYASFKLIPENLSNTSISV